MELKKDFRRAVKEIITTLIKYTANGVNGFETGENAVWQLPR
jgi:hypothetical protein